MIWECFDSQIHALWSLFASPCQVSFLLVHKDSLAIFSEHIYTLEDQKLAICYLILCCIHCNWYHNMQLYFSIQKVQELSELYVFWLRYLQFITNEIKWIYSPNVLHQWWFMNGEFSSPVVSLPHPFTCFMIQRQT